jgi:hypothetical protein
MSVSIPLAISAHTGRARWTFGALAKAFSALLLDEQQEAWTEAAAAKGLNRPRLKQRGPVTDQQDFVGIKSARGRIGR